MVWLWLLCLPLFRGAGYNLSIFFYFFSEPFAFCVYRYRKSMIFQKNKYIGLVLILSLLILGFILMSGGGSDDPNVFNEQIFSFRRITLAPILIVGSYTALIWLILTKRHFDLPKKK
jgi:hypothetical protein